MSKSSLYLIIKCNDCDFFFGKHKKSNFSCTRCGEVQINPQIIGRTNDTEELHRLVSLNNIPQELRDDFSKINIKPEIKKTAFEEKKSIPYILKNSSNEQGEIYLKDLKKFLVKNKFEIDFEKVIEVSESEGLILRISKEKWLLLG
ncbi:MAG: Uncharacterised protein [Methanobacteriota archaeon]|nr:MAG: Uncharacterised protein [Euryarchaeota archaeon]